MAKSQATPYPLRMPKDLRDLLEEKTKDSGRSLNAEIVSILEDSIHNRNVKILLLPKMQRMISGKLLRYLDIDFKKKLPDLAKDLDRLIPLMSSVFESDVTGNIDIYQGSYHLDIVDNNGSLGWLFVQDVF